MCLVSPLQYSWTLFAGPLGEQNGWSLPSVQLGFMAFVSAQTLVQLPVGAFADRYGTVPIYPAAALLVAIGWGGIGILSNGIVLGCRRLPSLQVGKMPEQSFEQIFLGSPILRRYRRREYFEGCGECDFYMVCRGCPANVYSLTGSPLAKNPLCYRHLVDRQTDQVRKIPTGPALDISNEDEFAWIARNLSASLGRRFAAYLEDEILRDLFVDLAYDLDERRRFLADPEAYLLEINTPLPDDQRAFLMQHFSEQADDREIPINPRDEMAEAMFTRMLQTLKD